MKIWFGSIMALAVGVTLAAIRHLPAGRPDAPRRPSASAASQLFLAFGRHSRI